ncbi:hypothetical protein [Amycolatopsis sp. NPDC059657]|uniref:hypothetical protein n=1 Tax=Amycolatopsis sp. NPDC059657 TaxID=3346899 RepID=UPI00366CEE76
MNLHDAVHAVMKLLPTPIASDAKNCTRRTQGGGPSLADEARLLPTPTAINPNDHENPGHWLQRREKHRARKINGNGMGMPLSIAIRLLPTPRASDTGTAGRRAGPGFRPPLSQEVLPLVDPEAFLPTPRATDGTKGCPAQRGSKGDLMLPSAVMRLLVLDAGDGIS